MICRNILAGACFLLAVLPGAHALAQPGRSAHWFFGNGAGLDFSAGQPVADTSSSIYTIEGACSISDTSGNLLFYSDGNKVWNRYHQLMPNGTGLNSITTATQSCLIVPFPGHPQQYYIFTLLPGFSHSIVDMTLDGGNGDVVAASKNTLLFTSAGEEVAATLHCNAEDYWIVGRQRSSPASCIYHVYLLNQNGLSPPLTHTVTHPPAQVGHLAFSQDGRKLSSSMERNVNYIFDFDRQTGVLTLQDSLVVGGTYGDRFYSSAFSPDRSKLYAVYWLVGQYAYVAQWDMNAASINASRVAIDSVYFNGSTTGYGWIGRMQPGPDQRIYIARWGMSFQSCTNFSNYCIDSLDVIMQPDSAGLSCMHQRGGVSLNGRPTMIGLPSFPAQFIAPGIPQADCETAGITGQDEESGLTISPNPFHGTAAIVMPSHMNKAALQVFDTAGRLVREEVIASGAHYFDAAGLADGIYYCRIVTGSHVLIGKMIIVR